MVPMGPPAHPTPQAASHSCTALLQTMRAHSAGVTTSSAPADAEGPQQGTAPSLDQELEPLPSSQSSEKQQPSHPLQVCAFLQRQTERS